ncbi:DNA topoisomerase III alpha, putative [Eimeria maxima]|uniref:DNA topoisomerase n=1 Tax=Eimeria maxima TaxID=5804 RepID=U6M588_EIMMA|nr:DNA topoisomerase III alpha, putative [Eimeria maxima]CDJ59402.1 DNA topoisomerase III alpha, putative [Eimeria maxima]
MRDDLYLSPVLKRVSDSAKDIVENLKTYAKKCQWLVLWLDCDREGENIAFEEGFFSLSAVTLTAAPRWFALCSKVALTEYEFCSGQDVERACQHLQQPNEALAQAADARSEVDLRIGAAFTRFLTKRYQNKLSLQKGLIREDEERPGHRLLVDFQWGRQRLFDRAVVIAFLELCCENPEALITAVDSREVTRQRPVPLSGPLLSAKLTELIADYLIRLRNACVASYDKSHAILIALIFVCQVVLNGLAMDQMTMLEECENDDEWKVRRWQLHDKQFWRSSWKEITNMNCIYVFFRSALRGNHQALPCLLQVLLISRLILNYTAFRLAFFRVEVSDAIGFETKIELDIAGETFSATGLVVLEKNYLEVYPYDSWASRRLPRFLLHERFTPQDVTIQAGSTQPPTLLTEAELIDKMDKERNYAIKTDSQHFKPTDLGVALVEPDLRASMERDMTLIARGVERKVRLDSVPVL